MKAIDVPVDSFLHFVWSGSDGQQLGENDYLPLRPKSYAFETPKIDVTESIADDGNKQVSLVSDKPALFVTFDHGGKDIYSDNCFTLLPNRKKTIHVTRDRGKTTADAARSLQYLKG